MDTMTPDRHEADFEDVIALLRHTYDVRAADVEPLDHLAPASVAERSRSPRRPWLATAAAAVVVMGAVGVITFRDGGDSGPGAETTQPALHTNPPAAPPAAPRAPCVAAIAPPPLDGTAATWFLPTLPDGYHLQSLGAIFRRVVPASDPAAACCGDSGLHAVALPDFASMQRWVRTANTGEAAEYVSAVAHYDQANDPSMLPSGGDYTSVSIHGVPGVALAGSDPTVYWIEDGTMVTLRGSVAMTTSDLIALAEASTVMQGAVTLDPASVPGGFELVDPHEGVAAETDGYQVVSGRLASVDGSTGPISFRVVTALMSLDMVVENETERRVVDDVEYSVQVDAFDPAAVWVRWVTGGWEFEVVSTVGGIDGAMAVATSLREVTAEEARAAMREMTDYVLSLPTLAAAVLGDGTRVSVHAEEWQESNRAAICVEASEPVCQRTRLPVEEDTGVAETFVLEGQVRVLGWDRTVSDPQAGDLAVETEPAESGAGTFLSVVVPDQEPIPPVMWTNELGVVTGSLAEHWLLP